MRVVLIVGLLVLLLPICWAEVEISEVMYNPFGSDNNHEFVEIYSPEDLPDLTGWVIADSSHNDTLVLLIKANSSFALIVEEGFNYSGLENVSIYSAGATIGNNLNDLDEVYLFFPDLSRIDYFFYNSSWGGSNNGNSLCRFNGTWQECLTTPGMKNKIFSEEKKVRENEIVLTLSLDKTIYLGSEYTELFHINIKNKSPCVKENVTVYYNITNLKAVKNGNFTKEIGCSSSSSNGEFIPDETGNYTICGTIDYQNSSCMNFTVIDPATISCNISLELEMNETMIYEEGETIKFKPILINDENFPFIIEYWVEDLFGEIVKKKTNTTNTDKKSWKTNIAEEDRVLYVRAIVNPSCNDVNNSDNLVKRMFIVMRSTIEAMMPASEDDSSITITKISPEIVSFGKILKADVEIYKGSTNKYALSAWVQKSGNIVSEKTKFNLKTENADYKLTLPIQIDHNCDGKIEEGAGTLIVEGLDVYVEKEVYLAGINTDLCKESSRSGSTSSDEETRKLTHEVINLPSSVISGDDLKFEVKFSNDKQDHNFEIWSYVYRGSKCYSCFSSTIEREDSFQEFSLGAGREKTIEFLLPVDGELEEGEYKLKIKIRKDNQKTLKELTESITIKSLEVKEEVQEEEIVHETYSTNPFEFSQKVFSQKISKGPGIVVYENNSAQAKKFIPYFMAVVFGLLSLVLIRRN